MAWIYTVEFDYKKPFIIEMTYRWYDPFSWSKWRLADKGSLVGVPNWGVWFTDENRTHIFDDSPGDSILTHFLDNFGKVEWLIPGVTSIGNENIFYFALRGWTTGNFNQIQYGSKGKCSLNVNERRDWLGWQVTSVRAGI